MNLTRNNNFYHCGRFGNLFFTGMAMHFIAKKSNLKVAYKQHLLFQQLGIEWFIGMNSYTETIELLDHNFFPFVVSDKPLLKNISIQNNMWCQTKEFACLLGRYFSEEIQKQKIIQHNVFASRYQQNEDVFIHVRLGDIANTDLIHPFSYYDTALKEIPFRNGYISSDSIEHSICQALIKKYSLTIINEDEVRTIMFGSTCKYVVLSSGTFSWLIGLLSYYSTVYYPKIVRVWHGDIFIFDDWKEIVP